MITTDDEQFNIQAFSVTQNNNQFHSGNRTVDSRVTFDLFSLSIVSHNHESMIYLRSNRDVLISTLDL
jgi:hypothetical protein